MSLFKKFREFRENRRAKAVAKASKTIGYLKAMREDRAAAIDFLRSLDETEVAVPALLKRFNFSLENSILDSREKESVMEGIRVFEDKAVPFLKDFLKTSHNIAWPLKILNIIESESDFIRTLVSCLNFSDVSLDQEKTDKNYDILCYLGEYQLSEEVIKSLLPFLDVYDERMRFATVEVLLRHQYEIVPPALEKFLADHSAENTRIKQSVTEAFLANPWPIKEVASLLNKGLSAGLFINKEGRLERVKEHN